MSRPNELTFFDDAEDDTLAALVMDLAAQLHIERHLASIYFQALSCMLPTDIFN